MGQLLTFRSIGGGRAAGFNGLCNSNVDEKLSVSGIHSSHVIDDTYSWNVMVIAHEFGHTFGSRHTHACVWNGNGTAIDGCSGATEGSCGLPGIPSGGGTLMRYCHLQSVGVNFSLGFGLQPGNLIRSRVAGASCLDGCAPYCFENLTLTSSVPLNYLDKRTANNNLTAINSVLYGAYAEYSAGNSVFLKPGFRSYSGSNSYIYIEDCYQIQALGNPEVELDQDYDNKDLLKEELSVNLYPNPTPDIITIDSNHEIVFWELTNDVGNMYKSGRVDKLKKIQLNFADLNMGIYSIKIYLANGEFSYKKIIKQ